MVSPAYSVSWSTVNVLLFLLSYHWIYISPSMYFVIHSSSLSAKFSIKPITDTSSPKRIFPRIISGAFLQEAGSCNSFFSLVAGNVHAIVTFWILSAITSGATRTAFWFAILYVVVLEKNELFPYTVISARYAIPSQNFTSQGCSTWIVLPSVPFISRYHLTSPTTYDSFDAT